jgi:hypothetical protein
MKYFNFKRYKLSSVKKNLTILKGIFFKTSNYLKFKKYNPKPLLKYLNFRQLKYLTYRIFKYLDFKRYNFKKLFKNLNIGNYKLFPLYLFTSFFFYRNYILINTFFL